ncbi:hypothetical protein V5O48_013678 [Marasmius crinis-equi]|uniref:Integrase core domain-containing protein n=1 Tax=Marasmius crinis-equi TaxID=585013 RepID=A0ABR3EZS7_9AGAR
MSFPELPPFPVSSSYPAVQSWSSNIYSAYSRLKSTYDSAARILSQEEADPLRLQVHIGSLTDVIPVIEALDEYKEEEHLSEAWLVQVLELILDTIDELVSAKDVSGEREESRVHYPQPVKSVRTGRRGRPRLDIDADFMRESMEPRLSLKVGDVAKSVGIDYQFSTISDKELDDITRQYRSDKIGSGLRYLIGHVRSVYNLRVQRHRVYDSMKRVDGLRIVLHANNRLGVSRKPYEVQRPHGLWHLDGHCKLINYGIVIHGIVDGYTHTIKIVGIDAANNNRDTTVLDLELRAEADYGRPSRIRGDRGKENKGVALWIIARNGLNRGSFIWESSTHNTRIERLWVEVGTQFARRWKVFFLRLERLHHLDRSKKAHLWLLHQLFLDGIRDDCQSFRNEWNSHPISRHGHDKSPLQLLFLGQLKEGVYKHDDECADMTPQEIQDSYGIEGTPRVAPDNFVGAGYDGDEEPDGLEDKDEEPDASDEEWEGDEWEDVQTELDDKFIRSARAPKVRNPFEGNLELEKLFWVTLKDVSDEGHFPAGYGIRREEWVEGEYPSFERLHTGKKRGGKELVIELPENVWFPRAVLWTQALSVCIEIEHLASAQ